MTIRTYKVTLDTKNIIAPEPVYLRQGDKTGAVVIDATLMDNGSPVSLDSLTPMFKANTADGQAVIADSTGFNVLDSANGEFTYQVPNALSSVPGKITTAYFSLSDAHGSESTFDVAFIIKKAVDITKPQSEDYITIIDGTLDSLRDQMDSLKIDFNKIINNYNTGNFYNKSETDSKDSATLSSSKAYTDNSLKGISSVPETFTNLAAIQAKYPNGANGVMVAADNGHKYIWANGTWTDAGVYQSVGIADGSIGNKQLAPSTRYGSIASSEPARINSIAKTLTLESVWSVICGTESLSVGTDPTTTMTIALDPDNTDQKGFWIGFLPASKEFSVYPDPNNIPISAVYLGWISIANKVTYDLHINSVEVDGLDTESLAFDKKAVVASRNPFALDLKNKTLIPPAGYVNIFTSKGIYLLSIRDPVNLYNSDSATFVYYAISTGSITATNFTISQSSDLIFLGWISWDSPTPNYDFIFNYTVNGIAPGLGLSFGFANKVGTTFGDSITQAVNTNPTWTSLISDKLHLAQITNAGISGTTYSKDASRTDSAVDRVSTIKGQDLITVWFGINDYHFGRPLGAFGDGDVTTVFGAADYVYKTLITNNPTATIIVITPMKQHGYRTYPDSFTKNSAGLLQIDYVNAIKQVADYYSLPVLDFYQMSGMSPFVDAQKTQYFFDGLHPNAAGQYRVAQKISRFIEING